MDSSFLNEGGDSENDDTLLDFTEEQEAELATLEEEIGLNEATLESLHSKLTEIQSDIGKEESNIARYKLNISNLEIRQSNLRNSRDVNISLVKSMELTLKKCMMKLRRKLDERSNLGNPSLKTLTGRTSTEHGRENENVLYDIHPRDETLQESVVTSNTLMMNVKDDSTEITTTTSTKRKKDDFTDNSSEKPLLASGVEDDLDRKPLLDGEDNSEMHKDAENKEKSNQTKIDLKLICREIILENVVEHELHTDDILLRRIWSQTSFLYPNPLSKEISNAMLNDSSSMFPLFSLIQPKHWLLKTIDIINAETIAKIKLNQKETILRNYDSSEDNRQDDFATEILKENIRETCLDIFAQIKYIPFLSQINQAGSIENKPIDAVSNHDEDFKQLENNVVHDIDPNVALCPYELAGVCADDTCPFQHLKTHNTNNREKHQMKQTTHASSQNADDRMTSFLKGSSLKLPNLILPKTMAYKDNIDLHDGDKKRKVDFSIMPQQTCDGVDSKVNNLKHESGPAIKKMRSVDIGSEKPPKIDDEDCLMVSGISEANSSSDLNKGDHDNIDDSGSKFRSDLALDVESDYIALPEIKYENEANNKVSNKTPTLNGDDVGLNLQNSIESEWYISCTPNMKDSSPGALFLSIKDIPSISNFLSFFGFKVNMILDKRMDDNLKIQCIAKVVEEENCSDQETQRMRQYILDFEFFGRLIDAIRLCLNAGRFDLCRSLVVLGGQYLAPCSSYHIRKDQSDYTLFKNLLETLNMFVENSFVGYGSTSFYGSFKSQVALSILSSFLMTCHETISHHKVPTNPNESSKKNIEKLDELQAQWKSLFGACKEVLNSISSPYTTAGEDDQPDSQKEFFEKNMHKYGNTKSYRRIVRLILSNRHDAKKCFENLLQSTTLGSQISHSIVTMHPKQSEIGPQQYFEENIIPLYDFIKGTTAQMVEHLSKMTNKCSIKLSKLSLFTFFAPIVISHFSVFCMLLKDDKSIKSKTKNKNDFFGIGTFNNGAVVGAIKLLKSTIRKLQKVESDRNFGHRLLMVPLFSYMVSLSICSGNISEAQQILSEILFHSNAVVDSACSKNIFYDHHGPEFYSELLWSQLIQLRISFPPIQHLQHVDEKDLVEKSMHNRVASNDQKESTCIEHDLARACVYHEINLWKVFLPGDSNFVRNMNSILKTNSQPKENKSEFVAKMKRPNPTNQIRQICENIVCTLANHHHDDLVVPIGLPQSVRQDVILQSSSLQLLKFPSSILLLGKNLKHLQLVGCGFDSIPETIGYVCPNIQILKLTTNKLTRLPESIGNLTSLIELDISFNYLNNINFNIGNLKMIKILKASSNKIKEISTSICDCENLTFVDLRNNEVQSFPSNLPLKLSKLSTLLITGNPFCSEYLI